MKKHPSQIRPIFVRAFERKVSNDMSKLDDEIAARVKKMSPAHKRAYMNAKINPDYYSKIDY